MRLGKNWKETFSSADMKVFTKVEKSAKKKTFLNQMFKPFDSSDPFEYLILGSGFLILILMIAGVGL